MNIQNQWKRLAIGGVAALTLTAGTLWAVDSVSAASPTTGWVSTLSQQVQEFSGRGGPHGPGKGHGGALFGDQEQYLANALGISVEQLDAAQSSAREAGLNAALADGSITQEQFDAFQAKQALQEYLRTTYADARPEGTKAELIQEALTAGAITQAQADLLSTNSMRMGLAGGKGMRDSGRGEMGSVDREALLAEALGITVDELDTAQSAAHDAAIAAAVADGTITQEQADRMSAQQTFQEYLRATYPDARPQETMEVLIQNAVDAGAITQAQADLLLSGDGHKGPGSMDGRRGPRDGGMRGPGMSAPNSQDDTPRPDTQPNNSDDSDSQGESANSNT